MQERAWTKYVCALIMLGAVVFFPRIVTATTYSEVPLQNTGWSAIIDDRLKSQVGIHVMGIDTGTKSIILELDKWFIPLTPEDCIRIEFRKMDGRSDAFSRFVIGDEYIVNGTSTDWHGFNMMLSPNNVGFDSAFVPSHDPFQHYTFSEFNGYNDLPLEFRMDTGTVTHMGINNIFQPGSDSGSLVIQYDPAITYNPNQINSFILKEQPTPEPASLLLMALAGFLTWIRRK